MPTVLPSPSLLDLGWDDGWAAALAAEPGPALTPGRVTRIDRGLSTVLMAAGPVRVPAVTDLALAVGDWVALVAAPDRDGQWSVAAILPRRCAFRRATAGPAAREQVVAANIDTVLLVDAIDGRLSARHLERYVALAWQSGAAPAIVMTKADLADPEQLSRHLAEVRAAASEVPVHIVSAATGQGLDELARYLAAGRTVALLGLSGAGKSTLVNRLVGERLFATGAVRSDGKGRHTTTHRELVVVPGGGLLIDTPGMRALSVAAAIEGVALVFADIELLGSRCGFADCSHTTGPGCAVVAAVAAGELTATRLASWRRLRSEPPGEDPQIHRLRIVEQKRQKATAKVARAQSRATERSLTAHRPR